MFTALRLCCVAAAVLLATPSLRSVPPSAPAGHLDEEAVTARHILTKGARLRGKVFPTEVKPDEAFDADFIVKEINDEEFIIEGNWTRDSRLALRFKYVGLRLSLVGVRGGARTGGTRTNPSGKGVLTENGDLKTTFAWTLSTRRVKNQPVGGRVELSLVR